MIIYRTLILKIILYNILFARSQEESKIDHCVEYVYAPSRFYYNFFDQLLCIECEIGYIVSKNYKYCIDFRYELSYFQYANCKRLAEDGLCAEAINGIELLPNNQYTIVQDQKFFERCAIINESETGCLFPRFGYILQLSSQLIQRDIHKTFCALFNEILQVCVRFHQRFFGYYNTQQGVYLGENFLNPNQLIIFQESNKFCTQDFFFYDSYSIVGCIPVQNQMYLYRVLSICKRGQALRDDQQKCQNVIPYCLEYQEIQGKELCTKCQPFYKLYLQNCIKMTGCILFSRLNQNKCLKCDQSNKIQNGECILISKGKRFIQNIQDSSQKNLNLKSFNFQGSKNQFKDFYFTQQNNQSYEYKKFKSGFDDLYAIKSQDEKEHFFGKKNGIQHSSLTLKRLTQEGDFNILKDADYLCELKNQEKCILCKTPAKYYLDQQNNQCVKRVRSLLCENQSQNNDDCLNLFCQSQYVLNHRLVENFDLKNMETLNYLSFIQKQFFEFDYIMTDKEKEDLVKKYQFYGINLNVTDSFCINYSDKLNMGEQLFSFIDFYDSFCLKNKTQIKSKQELNYLYFTCSSHTLIQNKIFDKCINYNEEKSFCLECQQGFYFNSKTMICEKNIENCIIHSLNNTCILCQSGYQLISQTNCDPICGSFLPGNMFYFNSINILKSNDTYKIDCIKSKIGCKVFVNTICVECFEGYVQDYSVQKFNCYLDYNFPDCKVIDYTKKEDNINNKQYIHKNKQCIRCQEGYILFEGLCYCQKPKCLKHIHCDEKKCFKKFRSLFIGQLNLADNQFLEKYGEYYKVHECLIENCEICHEGNVCFKCRYGFYLEESSRVCNLKKEDTQIKKYGDTKCLQFSEDGINCMLCQPNYFLRQDLKCYESCQYDEQFQFTFQGNICYQCPLGCLTCSLQYNLLLNNKNLRCFQCQNGYFIYQKQNLCKKSCVFYQYENICFTKCPENFFQYEQQCTLKCPFYYKVEVESNICIQSCEGLFRYEDDPQKCSTFCEQEYVVDQINLICRICKISNCKVCSQKQENLCIQCQQNFILFDGKCIYLCSNLLTTQNKSDCPESKIQYCIKQEEERCVQCLTGTIYQEKVNQCFCDDQFIFENISNSCVKKCHQNCLICLASNQFVCQKCQPNKYFFFNSFSKIVSCLDKCPIGYYASLRYDDPNFKECLSCSENCYSCKDLQSCTECNLNYKEFYQKDLLFCICDDNKQCNRDFNLVLPISKYCPLKNCSKCSENQQICEECNQNWPYLYLNTCLQSCPIGTFLNQNNQCQNCHPLCNGCTNSSSKSCLSCVLSKHIVESENTCRCSNQKVFFQNQCYFACPRFTKLQDENDRVCELYCLDNNSFPVFKEDGQFEKCESIFDSSNSNFCEQNLINLSKFITFDIKRSQFVEQNNQSILIMIKIANTPRECYDFQLSFNPQFQEENYLDLQFKDFRIDSQLKFQFRIQSYIEVEQLKEKDSNKCRQNICTLYFQIYHNSLIKKTLKLKFDLKSELMSIQSISFPFINQILKFESDPNQLPKEKILDSLLSVKCIQDNACNNQSVNSQEFQPITLNIQILQKQSQKDMEKLVLIPAQIYLIMEDNKIQQIQDFYFNNNHNSQIKIEIIFKAQIKGKLMLVFSVFDSKLLSYEQFANKNQQIYYIQQSLYVQIQKQMELEDNLKGQIKNIDMKHKIYFALLISNLTIILIALLIALSICIQKCLKQYQQFDNNQIHSSDIFQNQNEQSQLENLNYKNEIRKI